MCDHPYYALTDANGRFSFDRVPMGEVEVVVWMRGLGARPYGGRDPDSTQVARQTLHSANRANVKCHGSAAQPAAVSISVP